MNEFDERRLVKKPKTELEQIKASSRIHTSTSIQRYNRCPRLWYYYHSLMVAPPESILDVNIGISIGSLVHECLETYFVGYANGNAFKDWGDHFKDYPEHVVQFARPMMKAYVNHSELIENLNVLMVEKEVHTSYKDHRLSGKIDAIVEYEGETWILDHKTSKMTPHQDHYRLHSQFNIYTYLAGTLGFKNIKGVLVNFLRVPQLRRRKEESIKEYESRIYDEIIEVETENSRKKPKYFRVFRLNKSRKEVEESLEDVEDTIYHAENDYSFRKNSDSCFKYKKACEFLDVCMGDIDVQSLGFKEDEHPELKML